MNHTSMKSMLPTAIFALFMSTAAFAGNGINEINQACANVGCFSGDGPGLPVEIDGSAGPSYMLTSNLELPNENTKGISLSAESISINLNGFAILGTTSCSGTPNVCSPVAPAGQARGIVAERPGMGQPRVAGTRVTNGVVAKTSGSGIALGPGSHVENVRAIFNGRVGIEVDSDSVVRESVAHRNQRGISAAGSGEVMYCAITENSDDGLTVGEGSTVTGNAVSENGNGILSGAGATISHNASTKNRSVGVFCKGGCSVIANTAYDNGENGIGDGIFCTEGCNVRANTVHENENFGIVLGANSAYSHNVVTDNLNGAVSGGVTGNDNYCAGTGVVSALCP